MDNISVVVRSRNEEQHIGYCLQSITDFIGKPEIILVDNESTDNTIRIVNSFEYHNVKKLNITNNDYTPGRALNISFFKTDFIKKNKFDERYAGKEDRYWAIDMINNGNNVLYDSDSVVNHFYTQNGATWKGIG